MIIVYYCFFVLYLYSINNRAKLSFAKKKITKNYTHLTLTIEYLLSDLDPFFLFLQNRKPHTDHLHHQTVRRRRF